MSGRADRIAALSPEQLSLLQARLKTLRGGGREQERIPRREDGGTAPLSFAQERIWLQDQLQPGAAAFNLSLAVRLAGRLDPVALRRSLDGIELRHEVLRTTFRPGEDGPVQVVHPPRGIQLREVDLRGEADGDAAVLRRAAEEAGVPFDLARDLPIRAALFRMGAEEQVLLLVLHHIATDRWSFGVLVEELVAQYVAFQEGGPAPLPDPPVQYADFAVWQRGRLRGEMLEEQLDFWRRQLAGVPGALNLPTDAPRAVPQPFRAGVQPVRIPPETTRALRELARAHEGTAYMVLLAAYAVLLRAVCGQDDLVVGSLIANRTRPEIERLVGCFANTLALRVRPAAAGSFAELLRSVRDLVLEAHRHQDLPFDRLVQELQPPREPGRSPFFQTVLNLQKAPAPAPAFGGLAVEVLPVQTGAATLDLYLALEETEAGIVGQLEYNAHLFERSTAALLAGAYQELLAAVARDPELDPARWELPAELREWTETARARSRGATLAVAATFTAEPLEPSLRFWADHLSLPLRPAFAPYGQVFQQLLDPAGLLGRNEDGLNVVLVRLEDWARGETDPAAATERVRRSVRELADAVRAAAERARVPLLLCVCPASPGAPAGYRTLEVELAASVAGLPGVHLATPADVLAAYPVDDLHDLAADELGHIPYTETFFAALGTALARRAHALLRPPRKVLVLDCDQVLWKGVCGEDGVHGVEVDPARRELQAFAVEQQCEGVLVCLCSRNREEDVLEVLRRDDMVLRREHLVDWRVNWLPKSDNLRSLAESLQLGMDSLVFVDDDPVVCAEVRAACPEVLTLRLPEDPGEIRVFLRNLWMLDRVRVTDEDRRRTELYREGAERERLRRAAPTLGAFLEGLELRVEVSAATPAEHPRLAQLTQRTNQFNASTRRLTEAQLAAWCAAPGRECLAVDVSDRFGAYGLVGAVLLARRDDALEVDTLLLSCRVLGRGVEHRVMAEVGARALALGCRRVEVPFVAAARNEPARVFLDEVAERGERGGAVVYHLSAEAAARCRFTPSAAVAEDGRPRPAPSPGGAAAPGSALPLSERYQRIAVELVDAERIRDAAREAERGAARGGAAEYVAPRNPIEEMLAEIWAEMLGVERVGVHDHFFALGGHSVRGAVLMARVAREFGVSLPLVKLFEAPTVAALGEAVEDALIRQLDAVEADLLGEEVRGLSEEEIRREMVGGGPAAAR